MNLTAEQILGNWEVFNQNIKTYITGERQKQLLLFYKKYEDRITLMPASHKKEYHNSFPGGYVEHVNRVVDASLQLYKVWEHFGSDMTLFTQEELVFSAINHDLGKLGDDEHESYIPQTDQWRKEKLGEDYTFNTKLAFASVPDRGLFLLQSNNIKYTFNEMIAIQTHDGLYDEGNKKYLMGYAVEQKFRNSLPLILHQADMLAARVEFETEWLPKFRGEVQNRVPVTTQGHTLGVNSKPSTKSRALNSISSPGLKSMLDSI